MFVNEKERDAGLPLYEVSELSMEEALLVLAAEKELLTEISPPIVTRWHEMTGGETARIRAETPG